jgi:hypothetical protein
VRDCLLRGESCSASHLLFTQPGILNDAIAAERALGIEAGLAWLVAAEAMVVYVDLGISPGMQSAMDRADQMNLSIEQRKIGVT